MKKAPGDIISHKCNKNHDHICYTVAEIWCMTNVIVIFSFWAIFCIFCPFTPSPLPPPLSTAQKIKLKKNKDKNNEQKHKGENILQCIQERLKVRK